MHLFVRMIFYTSTFLWVRNALTSVGLVYWLIVWAVPGEMRLEYQPDSQIK
jgi:hypothetical protein